MQMSLSTPINASPAKVWRVISDIENSHTTISGIHKIEVLERPKGNSMVGLKWKEWRTFAGREATEVMWITDAKKDSHYTARAESHGAIYLSTMAIAKTAKGCTLALTMDAQPVTMGAKVMWALTGWLAKGAMKKALRADLEEIKAAAEAM